jgi:xanthine dehydrogenase YagS FAD-binding subunit
MGHSSDAARSRGKRNVAMSDFSVPAEKSLVNETVLQHDEIITAVFVPAPERGIPEERRPPSERPIDWAELAFTTSNAWLDCS